MYLINCASYTLEFHHDPTSVRYLILSHTWGEDRDEVSYEDMANLATAKAKKGFRKIKEICAKAQQDGVPYAWVDTCCINKSSSAELSESINSMYHWYQCADRCIAYLDDLETGSGDALEHQLRLCRWFTRGWTLQELIAPEVVIFVDQSWKERGTKRGLGPILSRITRIHTAVLNGTRPLHKVAVAQRMSWAARRKTTRVEDMAYCLLGIFDINMPLLYGERQKAFVRLQEAILRQTGDLSIFAWDVAQQDGLSKDPRVEYYEAVPFAPNPACFQNCEIVECFSGNVLPSPSITITSAGVRLSACINSKKGSDDKLLHLQCKAIPDSTKQDEYLTLAIRLGPVPDGYMRWGDAFCAISPHLLDESHQELTEICLVSGIHLRSMVSASQGRRPATCVVRFNPARGVPNLTTLYYPQHLWDPGNNSFYAEWSDVFLGAVEVEVPASIPTKASRCWVLCGMARASTSATKPHNGSNGPNNDVTEWKFWAAILAESKDGTLPNLARGFQGTRLRNPYTLANVSHALRTELRGMHITFPRTCRVPYGNRVITFRVTATVNMQNNREVLISATL